MDTLRTSLFAVILMALLFTSCKKDDEQPQPEPTPTEPKLLASLSTSKAAYQSATAGSWVTITEAEYNKLAADLSNVTVSGMPQASFGTSVNNFWDSQSHTTVLAGTGITKMPAGSYLFAFKFIRNLTFTSTGSKVKISQTSGTTGFTDIGGVLPTATGTVNSTHYYVLKDNNTATTAANSYVGFFCNGSVIAASIGAIPNVGTDWAAGDVNTVNAVNNANEVHYQSLSTTTKQW